MGLPAELLHCISSTGGGRIALVLGAGCSVEAPTALPVASECSADLHWQLLQDGLLENGDCEDPTDLSLVADAVFAKHGSQRAVVERLRDRYDLELAPPNAGHLIAAAMLYEGVVSSVVTLNFDLAMTNALANLGAGSVVGIINRPEDLCHQKLINVFYLHRNVHAVDPELWVLRTDALESEWKDYWKPIIATKVLTAPVVVFAGLGTPVRVLIKSTTLLRNALPGITKFYQVDPSVKESSRFFKELSIDPSGYIQQGWCQFMEELSERLLGEQVHKLEQAVTHKINEDQLETENFADIRKCLSALGLVKLGKLRGHWLLHDKPYYPLDQTAVGLIADLLLGLAMMARVSGAATAFVEDGLVVEFRRDGRAVAAFVVASGRGYRGRVAVESDVRKRLRHHHSTAPPPQGLIAGGTSDSWTTVLAAPQDVIRGGTDPKDVVRGGARDIISGPATLPTFHISQLRDNPSVIRKLVP